MGNQFWPLWLLFSGFALRPWHYPPGSLEHIMIQGTSLEPSSGGRPRGFCNGGNRFSFVMWDLHWPEQGTVGALQKERAAFLKLHPHCELNNSSEQKKKKKKGRKIHPKNSNNWGFPFFRYASLGLCVKAVPPRILRLDTNTHELGQTFTHTSCSQARLQQQLWG